MDILPYNPSYANDIYTWTFEFPKDRIKYRTLIRFFKDNNYTYDEDWIVINVKKKICAMKD